MNVLIPKPQIILQQGLHGEPTEALVSLVLECLLGLNFPFSPF